MIEQRRPANPAKATTRRRVQDLGKRNPASIFDKKYERMNEDTNSNPNTGPAAESPDEGLARALEVLVANAPFRSSTQYKKAKGFTAPAAGSCPEVGDWLRLVDGDLPPQKKEALLAHAALCTGCLARLRESQRALSDDISPDEAAELKQFVSTTPQWQRRLALELAQTSHGSNTTGKLLHFAWLSGAVAAVLVLAFGASLWWRHETAPEKLLAEAYTQSRTFDLRVPGAVFAAIVPPTHLRGGATDREPAPLLTARAEIERSLEQSPTDPRWLQMQARAEILEEHYDGAIDILDRLLAAGPVTASLLLDDGTAYYMRGTASGSEDDRATALDNLRRADELAPNDPVVLFNEAIVMEDRGQVMNAVETWNRYLKFEHDPHWQDEGRQRLQSLEDKLNRIKTHESRMQQHLATPEAMRVLAAAPATLAGIDEEFSTTLLPRLLDAAFPLPVERSRGSPCAETCTAARLLLNALAVSLERNHQDPWLKDFLPSGSVPIDNQYVTAAHALGQAIDANTRGDYADASSWSLQSQQIFQRLKIPAGEDRAATERIYAEQRSFTFARCQQDAESLLTQRDKYYWIRAQALSLAAVCDMRPGAASMDNPLYAESFRLAETHHYFLLELRVRNAMASWAYQSGDNEDAWRLLLVALRSFYSGDFPPFRAGTFMASLALVEEGTPRVHLSLLINREELALFELAQNRTISAYARSELIRAALRAGAIQEARDQIKRAQSESSAIQNEALPRAAQAENELNLADLYLDRRDPNAAAQQLDAAKDHLRGEDDWFQSANYATERGELELALGHPERAESTLREALLTEELRAHGGGPPYVVSARQDRNLYAALAGVWLAENRPALEILALWERYRFRILGKPVGACANKRLDCLKSDVERSLNWEFPRNGHRRLVGQIVLRDRILLYSADAQQIVWRRRTISETEVFSAVASLEHVTGSPASSQASIDQSARRVGDLFLSGWNLFPNATRAILVEPDPLLGNLPWPAVETAEGPIGLHFDLEELPSLLLAGATGTASGEKAHGRSLVIGASIAAGESQPLPEALREARIVAGPDSNLLLAREATEPNVAMRLQSAPLIHFAGHAAQYEGETRLLLAPSGAPSDEPYLDESLLRRNPPKAARLAVFSACSTGKREEGWNHGMGDIVDTLASLGVPEVVATRWQIDSASAVPMMDAFYRGLENGLTVPQALTAARQSLIRDARYKHPYYWAAYYASGMGTTDLREVFHGSNN
jgi:CHAT domain-containing protein